MRSDGVNTLVQKLNIKSSESGEEKMACHTIQTADLMDALLWALQYDSRRI